MRRLLIVAGLLAAVFSGPALAEEPATGAVKCDVAVWTTTRYSATRLGLVTGGLLDQLLTQKEVKEINSTDAIKEMLSADVLFEVISNSELPEILDRPVNYIHVAKPEDETKVDLKSKQRNLASDNPCYIEVFITFINYQSAAFHGERIFSWYTVKDFRGPKMIKTGGYDNGQMKDFSKQDIPGATALARGAVKEVFEKIARKKLATRR